MSTKDLAHKANICGQQLSTIKVRGTCQPKTAGKIASALGVDVTALVDSAS